MAYCGPRGVPYETTWLSWSDIDRAAALAWQEREADRCPSCGLHHSEVSGDRRDLPVVGEYRYCAGCEAKELTAKPEGEHRKWRHFRWRPRRASGPGG